jgi:hypothetical protein
MISCRVRYAVSSRTTYTIQQIDQVRTRPLPKTYHLCLHLFFREIKHILRNVFDLNRVRVGFSADKTAPLNQFIADVFRMLGAGAICRGVFVVIFDGPALLFAGVV